VISLHIYTVSVKKYFKVILQQLGYNWSERNILKLVFN